jgi:hypothetical protein
MARMPGTLAHAAAPASILPGSVRSRQAASMELLTSISYQHHAWLPLASTRGSVLVSIHDL